MTSVQVFEGDGIDRTTASVWVIARRRLARPGVIHTQELYPRWYDYGRWHHQMDSAERFASKTAAQASIDSWPVNKNWVYFPFPTEITEGSEKTYH